MHFHVLFLAFFFFWRCTILLDDFCRFDDDFISIYNGLIILSIDGSTILNWFLSRFKNDLKLTSIWFQFNYYILLDHITKSMTLPTKIWWIHIKFALNFWIHITERKRCKVKIMISKTGLNKKSKLVQGSRPKLRGLYEHIKAMDLTMQF